METWTYQQIVDPNLLESCIQNPGAVTGRVVLELADGKIACAKRQAFLNLFWWPILTRFNIPICKRHFVKRVPLNRDTMTKIWNPYYEEVMQQNPQNIDALTRVCWDVLQKLYIFTYTKLGEYTSTIDILDIAQMMNTPRVKEILATKEKISPAQGTNVIEKFIDVNSAEIMKLMGTKGALDNEAFYPYQQLKLLNKMQIPQVLYAFGVRTDISDTIISLPVVGSAVDGLRDIKEYAVESLSAKKSAVYNKLNVPDSQYMGRKQHLVASSVQHIYHGDCGSTAYVRFRITENNCNNVVGKYIVENGQLKELTESNVHNYINTTVSMRSPMTCRYRKGVCEVCGGKIFSNLDKRLNIGIISATHVIEPTTQKILSAKHLIKTNSQVYELPSQTTEVLFSSTARDIRWKSSVHHLIKDMWLGVPLDSFMGQIEDVNALRSDKEVREERLSSVPYFALRYKGTIKKYPLDNGDGRKPFFSKEMLFHIRDNFGRITNDDELRWIPLDGTEKFPIFKTVVINDNMQAFVKRVGKFLSTEIADYHSCEEALGALSDIIYSKVVTNIVHIEILLKAYEITSCSDYSIPLVEDPNNVMFQNTAKILSFRSVSVECGFEGLKKYLTNPSTYLIAKGRNPFDLLIGYNSY